MGKLIVLLIFIGLVLYVFGLFKNSYLMYKGREGEIENSKVTKFSKRMFNISCFIAFIFAAIAILG